MKDRVTLNSTEQLRAMILNQVERGRMTGEVAAGALKVSLRQTRRILAAYRKEGAGALAHGNRGKRPCNAVEKELRERVVLLAESTYGGCNNQHFTELLAEKEGIVLSRSTVRRLLLAEGIKSPRKRRPPKHRSRRERRAQQGMLLQVDGSNHDWLEGRGPRLTLIGAIDDATGEVPYALFREEEDAQGYFLLLRGIVKSHGIPLALYHDKHGIFEHAQSVRESLEEELEGRRYPTQFGRVMEELGIASISANSPQAKGRVERLWETLQDRLRSELRIAGATNAREANLVLGSFLPRHNHRFSVPASSPGSAYRRPGRGFKPDEVFCFKYRRTVGTDNVVRFGEHRFQIGPDSRRRSYSLAKVAVHERLDGTIAVYHDGYCLATKPAPPEAPVLRARHSDQARSGKAFRDRFQVPPPPPQEASAPANAGQTTPPHRRKPAADHPWRRGFVYLDRG